MRGKRASAITLLTILLLRIGARQIVNAMTAIALFEMVATVATSHETPALGGNSAAADDDDDQFLNTRRARPQRFSDYRAPLLYNVLPFPHLTRRPLNSRTIRIALPEPADPSIHPPT